MAPKTRMFSVVVPLHDKEQLIERTLAAALGQSFADFELIVVDDGSTDSSVERVERIADPRLRLVRQANAGPGAARNAAMRQSRGEWIAFLDADDVWFPGHLAELAAMARDFPRAGLLATSQLKGRDLHPACPEQPARQAGEIDYFETAARGFGAVWTSATAVRADVARAVGEFCDAASNQDQEYWARVALAAPVVKSNQITAYYYLNEASLAAQLNRSQAANDAPRSIDEVSASVAYLERIKNLPEHARRRAAMERYQRHAVWLAMAGCVTRRDFAKARELRRLLPGHYADRPAMLAIALRLPAALLRLGLALRDAARGALRGAVRGQWRGGPGYR